MGSTIGMGDTSMGSSDVIAAVQNEKQKQKPKMSILANMF